MHINIYKKVVSVLVICTFGVSMIFPPRVQAQFALDLPSPGAMVSLSQSYMPACIRGLKVYPKEPLRFDFILDKGDTHLSDEEIKQESTKLIKYFLTTLTIPEEDLWVNLSPYEKDRIVPNAFGDTEMGRDLLAQDYLLKQITSSLMYPEKELGRKFWDKVYQKAEEKFGVTDIPLDTFNKVWIVPEKAVVYENGDKAFVVESRLKVMLEEDYKAMQYAKGGGKVMLSRRSEESEAGIPTSSIASEVIRQIILPALEKEVNEGEHFASLRQIYQSMILATWYKRKLRDSVFGKAYVGKNKVDGVETKDKKIKQKIYERYLEAFKKGAYNYIKEEFDPVTQQIVPRKYFSGGASFSMLGKETDGAMTVTKTMNKIQRTFLQTALVGSLLLFVSCAPAHFMNKSGQVLFDSHTPTNVSINVPTSQGIDEDQWRSLEKLNTDGFERTPAQVIREQIPSADPELTRKLLEMTLHADEGNNLSRISDSEMRNIRDIGIKALPYLIVISEHGNYFVQETNAADYIMELGRMTVENNDIDGLNKFFDYFLKQGERKSPGEMMEYFRILKDHPEVITPNIIKRTKAVIEFNKDKTSLRKKFKPHFLKKLIEVSSKSNVEFTIQNVLPEYIESLLEMNSKEQSISMEWDVWDSVDALKYQEMNQLILDLGDTHESRLLIVQMIKRLILEYPEFFLDYGRRFTSFISFDEFRTILSDLEANGFNYRLAFNMDITPEESARMDTKNFEINDRLITLSGKNTKVFNSSIVKQFAQEMVRGVKARVDYLKSRVGSYNIVGYTGIQLDFANNGKRNVANWAKRLISENPHIVGYIASLQIKAALKFGSIPVIKHFLNPSKNPSTYPADYNQNIHTKDFQNRLFFGNTHDGFVYLDGNKDELVRNMIPYKYAIEAGVPIIMFGHTVVPSISNRPMSISPEAVKLVRGMGFEGVIMDDVNENMHGFTDFYMSKKMFKNINNKKFDPVFGKMFVDIIRAGVNLIYVINFDESNMDRPGNLVKYTLGEIEKEKQLGRTDLVEKINDSVKRILKVKVQTFGPEFLEQFVPIADKNNPKEINSAIDEVVKKLSWDVKIKQMMMGFGNTKRLDLGGVFNGIPDEDKIQKPKGWIPGLHFGDGWYRGKAPSLFGKLFEKILKKLGIDSSAFDDQGESIAKKITVEQLYEKGITEDLLAQRLKDFGYDENRPHPGHPLNLSLDQQFIEDQLLLGNSLEDMADVLKTRIDYKYLLAHGLSEQEIKQACNDMNLKNYGDAIVELTSYLQNAFKNGTLDIVGFFERKISKNDILSAGLTVEQVQRKLTELGYEPGEINGAWNDVTRNAVKVFVMNQEHRNMRKLKDLLGVLKGDMDQFVRSPYQNHFLKYSDFVGNENTDQAMIAEESWRPDVKSILHASHLDLLKETTQAIQTFSSLKLIRNDDKGVIFKAKGIDNLEYSVKFADPLYNDYRSAEKIKGEHVIAYSRYRDSHNREVVVSHWLSSPNNWQGIDLDIQNSEPINIRDFFKKIYQHPKFPELWEKLLFECVSAHKEVVKSGFYIDDFILHNFWITEVDGVITGKLGDFGNTDEIAKGSYIDFVDRVNDMIRFFTEFAPNQIKGSRFEINFGKLLRYLSSPRHEISQKDYQKIMKAFIDSKDNLIEKIDIFVKGVLANEDKAMGIKKEPEKNILKTSRAINKSFNNYPLLAGFKKSEFTLWVGRIKEREKRKLLPIRIGRYIYDVDLNTSEVLPKTPESHDALLINAKYNSQKSILNLTVDDASFEIDINKLFNPGKNKTILRIATKEDTGKELSLFLKLGRRKYPYRRIGGEWEFNKRGGLVLKIYNANFQWIKFDNDPIVYSFEGLGIMSDLLKKMVDELPEAPELIIEQVNDDASINEFWENVKDALKISEQFPGVRDDAIDLSLIREKLGNEKYEDFIARFNRVFDDIKWGRVLKAAGYVPRVKTYRGDNGKIWINPYTIYALHESQLRGVDFQDIMFAEDFDDYAMITDRVTMKKDQMVAKMFIKELNKKTVSSLANGRKFKIFAKMGNADHNEISLFLESGKERIRVGNFSIYDGSVVQSYVNTRHTKLMATMKNLEGQGLAKQIYNHIIDIMPYRMERHFNIISADARVSLKDRFTLNQDGDVIMIKDRMGNLLEKASQLKVVDKKPIDVNTGEISLLEVLKSTAAGSIALDREELASNFEMTYEMSRGVEAFKVLLEKAEKEKKDRIESFYIYTTKTKLKTRTDVFDDYDNAMTVQKKDEINLNPYELSDRLSSENIAEVDTALEDLDMLKDPSLINETVTQALRNHDLVAKFIGNILHVELLNVYGDEYAQLKMLIDEPSQSLEIVIANINDSENYGKRVMPLLLRWIATNPQYIRKFTGWTIGVKSASLRMKNAWMRGGYFNPSAKAKNQVNAFELFGQFPDWNKVGGIDLNPNQLEIETQGQGMDFDLPDISVEELEKATGFVPIILKVIPVTNINLLLGIKDDELGHDLKQV